MIRILVYLSVLAALAFGLAQIADAPGALSLKWPWWPLYGKTVEIAPLAAALIVLIAFTGFYIAVAVLRFILRIPSIMSLTARARRQNKGVAAVSRGMIAAGAGDARAAERASREALKLLGPAPLALLLQAQAAQLSGNRQSAGQAFQQMKDTPETRVIGLRGLYLEARRAGDEEAAYAYAQEAHRIAALPWAGQAILEQHTMSGGWREALSVVEANIARKTTDKPTGNRQRAVLKTAIARDFSEREPEEALQLVREAINLAPDLIPAYALAGRLLARKGDLRRGARILETGWKASPHPDIAAAYLDLRPGDAPADRLTRAQTLSRLNSGHSESRLTLARAALEAREFALARQTIAPLIEMSGVRPTVRTCLLMADLEETEHGPSGRVREWLARATRAPRDPIWIADGLISDSWAPASPVTGRLDAFVWETPAERLSDMDMPFALEQQDTQGAALPPEMLAGPQSSDNAKPAEIIEAAAEPEITVKPPVAPDIEPAAAPAPKPEPAPAPEKPAPKISLNGQPDDPGPR